MNLDQIRKQWLIILLVNFCYALPILLWHFKKQQELLNISSTVQQGLLALLVLIQAAFGYALFHFCYKKRSTKFPAFIFFISAFSLLMSIYTEWSGHPSLADFSGWVRALSFCISTLWTVANFRLWQANREWKTSLKNIG